MKYFFNTYILYPILDLYVQIKLKTIVKWKQSRCKHTFVFSHRNAYDGNYGAAENVRVCSKCGKTSIKTRYDLKPNYGKGTKSQPKYTKYR